MKKPWVFIRVPYMDPNILGFIGPGFLNQVPTLGKRIMGLGLRGLCQGLEGSLGR